MRIRVKLVESGSKTLRALGGLWVAKPGGASWFGGSLGHPVRDTLEHRARPEKPSAAENRSAHRHMLAVGSGVTLLRAAKSNVHSRHGCTGIAPLSMLRAWT